MTLPDVDTIDTFGGALEDYGIGIVDPTTDRAAEDGNKAFANVAMMTHTNPRAVCRFVGHATTPTDPTSGLVHDAQWGDAVAVKPTVAKTGTGVYTITWPTDVDDELSESHALNLKAAWGQAEGSTAYHVQCSVTSANVVTVYVFDMAGTANNAAAATISVWVR